MNEKKVVVGLSGGVDSSVAAYLLKKQGYEVIGVTLQMESEKTNANVIKDARAVAMALDIPFHVADYSTVFHEKIQQYFVEEYTQGRTPNPCVRCNPNVKWQALLEYANKFNCYYVATGHYAKINKLKSGRFAVANSVTAKKDQTYALYQLTQEQLERTLMPLGEYEKDRIREIAKEANIPVANKAESQDICFIPDGDYVEYIENHGGKALNQPGNFVDQLGNILGQHQGIIHYTVGQRKGLQLSMGYPVFVQRIDVPNNEIIIGDNESLFQKKFIIGQVCFMGIDPVNQSIEAGKREKVINNKELKLDSLHLLGKVRYSHKGTMCTIKLNPDGTIRGEFDEPVRAITPGQSLVLYQNEYVALGGIIL